MKPNTSQPVFIVNGRFLTQQVSGVQAFARSICRELQKVTNFSIVVPGKEALIDDEFSSNIIRYGKLRGHLWEQLELPAFVKKNKGVTLLNLCNTAPLRLRNQVVTIHDIAFIQNPDWFHPAFSTYYRLLIPQICKKSKAILTVSTSVKNELEQTFKIASSKIEVIGNKVSESLLNENAEQPSGINLSKGNFFLMVGSDDPRKNFKIAEELFRTNFHGKKLVVAGGSNRNFNLGKSHDTASEHIFKTGFINDSGLKWLYQNAIALINPSVYEGFGIPNLEAMAFNCPVICSNIPVFREICGEAAHYFNPSEKNSLKVTLEKLLDNKESSSSKINKGKVIFEGFQSADRSSIILKALSK